MSWGNRVRDEDRNVESHEEGLERISWRIQSKTVFIPKPTNKDLQSISHLRLEKAMSSLIDLQSSISILLLMYCRVYIRTKTARVERIKQINWTVNCAVANPGGFTKFGMMPSGGFRAGPLRRASSSAAVIFAGKVIIHEGMMCCAKETHSARGMINSGGFMLTVWTNVKCSTLARSQPGLRLCHERAWRSRPLTWLH